MISSINEFRNPFFIGVAGTGMSALAQYLKGIGKNVSGSDRFFTPGTYNEMQEKLETEGIRVSRFYFCPHGPADGCDCRKPRPGMIRRAERDLRLDLSRSYLIGDKSVDVDAARAAGVVPILVLTGYGAHERRKVSRTVRRAKTLSEAVTAILADSAQDRR